MPRTEDARLAYWARRLELFVRALWNRELMLVPVPGHDPAVWPVPSLREGSLRLGGHVPVSLGSASLLYRAAVTHAMSHRAHGDLPFDAGGLNLRQQLMVAMVEDARVEALAMAELPGLGRLWCDVHGVPDARKDFPGLLRRMSYTLLRAVAGVPGADDDHPLVVRAMQRFLDLRPHWTDARISRELGLALANDLGQMRLPAHSREWPAAAPYRDDNRHLFMTRRELEPPESDAPGAVRPGAARGARLQEADEGARLDLAAADAPVTRGGGLRLQTAGDMPVLSFRAEASRDDREIAGVSYPEWHHRMARYRKNWCRVLDGVYPHQQPADALLACHEFTLRRMRRRLDAWRLRAWRIARAQPDGDELDLDAAVRAVVSRRLGEAPDPRIYHRGLRNEGYGPAVLVLLDLSASLERPVNGAGRTLAELARDAALMLAETLQQAGHPFAVHGFHSDTRHRVSYRRFKDLDRPYDDDARARLAGLRVGGSTRLGVALRHGGAGLVGRHPLLLVISDGEPSDIDVHDPGHLRHDARMAVREQRSRGIAVHCLNLDPANHARAEWIFGARHVSRIRDLTRLPDRLPEIFMSLVHAR